MEIGLILTGGSTRGSVELAQRAEQAGLDLVMSVEFFNQHGYVVLGAIAQATSRIRIGTGIANSFTRSPLLHASAAMDLDELSEGRMVLGLGSGTRRMNEEWYGVPFSRPAARTRELIELLRIFETGQLRPVLDRILPLEEAPAAQEALESRETFGKIVLTVGDPEVARRSPAGTRAVEQEERA